MGEKRNESRKDSRGNDSLGGRRKSAVHAGGPSRPRRTWTYLNYDPELRWRCRKARRREEKAEGEAEQQQSGLMTRGGGPAGHSDLDRRRPLKRSDALHTVGGRRGLDATNDHPRPAPASARLHLRGRPPSLDATTTAFGRFPVPSGGCLARVGCSAIRACVRLADDRCSAASQILFLLGHGPL